MRKCNWTFLELPGCEHNIDEMKHSAVTQIEDSESRRRQTQDYQLDVERKAV